MRSVESRSGAARSLAMAVFAFFLAFYAVTMPTSGVGGDYRFMLLVCQSLAEDGDIHVLNEGLRDPEEYTEDTSKFPLVPSLVGIPFYWMGKWGYAALGKSPSTSDLFYVTSFSSVFISALTCLLLFKFLLRMGFRPQTALLSTVFFGLGTTAWYHSHLVATEPTSTFGALAAIYSAYRYKTKGSLGWLFLSGCFTGFGIGARDMLLLMAPPLLIYSIMAKKPSAEQAAVKSQWLRMLGRVLVYSLGLVPFLIMNLWYNLARYGVLENIGYLGYGGQTSELFKNPLFGGLFGLLLSPGKGLFFFCPIVVLVFFALKSFYRNHKAECLLIFAIVLSQLLAYAKSNFWEGGDAHGPRYLLPIIPLMFPIIAEFLETLPARGWRMKSFVALLFCASIAVQTTPYWMQPPAELDAIIKMAATLDLGPLWFIRENLSEYIPLAYPLLWKPLPFKDVLSGLYFMPESFPSRDFYLLLFLLSIVVGTGFYLVKNMEVAPSLNAFRPFAVRLLERSRALARKNLRYKLAAITGAVVLLVLGWGGYAALKATFIMLKQYNARPFGSIEDPPEKYPAKPTMTGHAQVSGWALDRSPLSAIDIYIDDVKMGHALYGQDSSDLYDTFPYLPNSRNARYSAEVDTSALKDGVHVLRVRALNQKGVWTEVASRVVLLVNEIHYDFWQHLATAQKSSEESIEDNTLSIGEETRRVLLQRPGSKLTFENIPTRAHGLLDVGIGLSYENELVEDQSFLLEVRANLDPPIFSRTIDLKTYAEQPQWLAERIDLSPYQNQVIALTFTVKSQPENENSVVRIGWSRLTIAYPDAIEPLK